MIKIRFKDYLKDYLEINNISNKDFANWIGISQKHLARILSGKCDLSYKIVKDISSVTGISCDYIYKIEISYKLNKDITDYL